jgi:hypothetical protein
VTAPRLGDAPYMPLQMFVSYGDKTLLAEQFDSIGLGGIHPPPRHGGSPVEHSRHSATGWAGCA